jgi:hypothetical protein
VRIIDRREVERGGSVEEDEGLMGDCVDLWRIGMHVALGRNVV